MVGFRVFDVGLLVVWLIWFFRLRDDDDESQGDDGGGGEGPGSAAGQGRARAETASGCRSAAGASATAATAPTAGPPRPSRRRGAEPPIRQPLPSRVRRPRSPMPTHRS